MMAPRRWPRTQIREPPLEDKPPTATTACTKETIISTHQPNQPGHLATREDLVARQVPVADQSVPVVQHQTTGLHWPQYVNTHRLIGGLVAGFAALHIANMIGYWMPGIGLPKLDFAYFNGAILMPNAAATPQWFEGQLFHAFNGIVFALGYALVIFPRLGKTLTTARNVGRGVAMGMVLATMSCLWWIPTQHPELNPGFMSHNLGWELVLAVYVWHLAWSLALGFFFNPQD
jgi:hypothetical protein